MLKVLVLPCDIQFHTCFSVLEVKSTCLCFVRICTQVVPFIVLARLCGASVRMVSVCSKVLRCVAIHSID